MRIGKLLELGLDAGYAEVVYGKSVSKGARLYCDVKGFERNGHGMWEMVYQTDFLDPKAVYGSKWAPDLRRYLPIDQIRKVRVISFEEFMANKGFNTPVQDF
ncbi:MAG: hypothetical protein HY518_02475 [Candidatus Aenigmarchaeota archaeon]|nr:hypothetical protein [Candidatus Aenigmarchaeota archaeon]